MNVRETAFLGMLRDAGLPEPVAEHRFHPVRRFRFDWAWVAEKVAVEVEGGVYTRGAHGSVSGLLRDIEKYNLATISAWRVLRVLPSKLATDDTVEMIAGLLKG